MKTTLITFFDIKVLTVYFEFIPQGQTVNQAHYVEIMKLCVEKGRNLGPTIGFSTIKMLPVHKALSSSFWPQKN
jgi:hypothetical protein